MERRGVNVSKHVHIRNNHIGICYARHKCFASPRVLFVTVMYMNVQFLLSQRQSNRFLDRFECFFFKPFFVRLCWKVCEKPLLFHLPDLHTGTPVCYVRFVGPFLQPRNVSIANKKLLQYIIVKFGRVPVHQTKSKIGGKTM